MPEKENPFGLHAMYGLCEVKRSGEILQLCPCEDGLIYKIQGGTERIFLLCPEYGNGHTTVTVVCKENGKPLRVIREKEGSFSFPYHYQAAFAGKKLITIAAHQPEGYTITELSILNVCDNRYMVDSRHIWGGNELPKEFSHFKDALVAADKKRRCLSCNEIHFEEVFSSADF